MAPEILVFACNWNGLSSVEAAGNGGLHYPASVKVVKVSCLSRVHLGLILRAFQFGAQGVMLLGCEPGKCHFDTESKGIANEYEKARRLLEMLGISKGRLVLVQLSASAGQQFVLEVTRLIAEIRQMPISEGAVRAS